METGTTIRKRDAAATRAAILAAARQRFLRESYDSVGLREIAALAGVDVALISRYFGGKEGLFREVLGHDDKRPDLFHEPQSVDELPDFMARLIMEDEDEDRHQRMEMFVILLRSASSPKAGVIIRDMVREEVLEPLAATIGGDHPEMRAHMLLAILMGVGVLRTVMEAEPVEMSEENGDMCRASFRNLFDAALKG
ncbi:MAG: TetR family transcriptional regulator [Sphingopyxis sp.]|uniref:TetR/AcrR family transcriptional regulator n=1 Tax=Sphingopyxis sp. TaxID=1908224 RepID=UPI002AB90D76|nr:TetR family transcriptional regulator [Sphingopyxis sp.]MDZ3832287.1 TetR family transcriptional regulator [Sphingopyxis sp.]